VCALKKIISKAFAMRLRYPVSKTAGTNVTKDKEATDYGEE